MPPDLWSLYESMLRCRLFEEAVAQLWRDGLTQSAELAYPHPSAGRPPMPVC